jgi:hypothetical protein
MTGFRPFFNAATGERTEFTAVPENIERVNATHRAADVG